MYIVYETTNLVNGKYYVGVHKVNGDNKYLGSGIVLNKAIKKYGVDNFLRVTLKEFNNSNDAYTFEREVVDKDLVENKNCYNIVIGGYGAVSGKDHFMYGKKHSKETIKNMSAAQKGKIVSKETRKKISESCKGRVISKEHRKCISAAQKGKIVSKETRKKLSKLGMGRKHSEETCRKIGDGNKGKTCSKETRKKISKSKKGTNKGRDNHFSKTWFIYGKMFYSSKEAGEFFNVSYSTIIKWCNPKSKYHIPLCYSAKKNRLILTPNKRLS